MVTLRETSAEPGTAATVGSSHDPRPESWRAADALLDKRANPKWASLSWATLRPLISSVNQVLIGASPTLVAHLRQYWSQQVGPVDLRLIDLPDADSFVLLGDPGEQDRSQYIVAPPLRRVVERETPSFGVICSDVIYPSGDVNDYVHGFYLPYGPDPAAPSVTTGLEHLPFFALPGNHDWHDGLSGFMQHFCAASRLDLGTLGWPRELTGTGAQWLEAVRRMLLRRPDRFRAQPLWLGERGTAYAEPMGLDDFRALRGPHPRQPGSYFAIRMRDLTVVAIDTGIGLGEGESAIDSRQGLWLEQVSALPGPKLLLTGNPMLVNAERHTCAIEPPEPGQDGDRPVHRTVNEIVDEPAYGYVGVIGGDIHNFQHYVVEQPLPPGQGSGSRVVHHVVSGGGGAYMSATHPVRVVQQTRVARYQEQRGEQARHQDGTAQSDPIDGRIDRPISAPISAPVEGTGADRITPPPVTSTSPPAGLDASMPSGKMPDVMAPTPVESLQHFTRLLLPRLWRLERALLAAVAGLAAGGLASAQVDPGALLVVAGLALAGTAVLRVAVPTRVLRRPAFPMSVYRAVLVAVAFVIGVALAAAVHWLIPRWATTILVGWCWLTAAGTLVGWLMRRTGWWRDQYVEHLGLPTERRERLDPGTRAAVAVSGLLAVASAAGFGWWAVGEPSPAGLTDVVAGVPSDVLWLVPAIVVAVIGLVAVVTFVRVRPEAPATKVWGRWAPAASYLVQTGAALAVLTYTVYPRRPTLPWAVVCGLLVFPLTMLAGLAIAALVLRLATLTAGSASSRRWGEWGRFGQWGIGVAVVVLLGLQLLVSGDDGVAGGEPVMVTQIQVAMLVPGVVAAFAALALAWQAWSRRGIPGVPGRSIAVRWGVAAAAAALAVSQVGFVVALEGAQLLATYRAQLGTQLTLITIVLMTLLIDVLRRMRRGRQGYKLAAVAAFAALAGLIWLLDRALGWVLHSAVASVVVILLVLITLSLVHLTYLGAYTLLADPQAHRDDQRLLDPAQAKQFLDWRVTPLDERKKLRGAAFHRAKIVFPATDKPQGPIQRFVAEIFDSDRPPFVKNFLHLRTVDGRLRIQVFVVRGTSTIEADATPMMEIVVPLTQRSVA